MNKVNRRGFSLVSILLTLVILGALYMLVMKTYFKPAVADDATKKALAGQGIDASNPAGFAQKAQSAVDKANQSIEDRAGEAAAGQ